MRCIALQCMVLESGVGIHEWDGGTSPQMCRQISDKTVRPMVVPPLSPPSRFLKVYLFCLVPKTIAIRAGHAYAEYANDADYAHMRNMRMRMRIENLIHIIHI